MMNTLTLLRHAKSSWKDLSRGDIERPLNKRGKADAPAMGKRLNRRGLRPDRVVTSPARRARRTAEIIAGELGFRKSGLHEDHRIYEAAVPDLLEVIRQLPEKDHHVLLVGHNPGLTDLANHLIRERIDSIPTCGALCIGFETALKDVIRKAGTLVFFDCPRKP